MNHIDTLKAQITELEDQAGQIDPNDKEALYAILVQAFFKAKDIIEHYNKENPAPAEVPDTTNWEELIAGLNVTITKIVEERDDLDGQLSEKQMAVDLLVKDLERADDKYGKLVTDIKKTCNYLLDEVE